MSHFAFHSDPRTRRLSVVQNANPHADFFTDLKRERFWVRFIRCLYQHVSQGVRHASRSLSFWWVILLTAQNRAYHAGCDLEGGHCGAPSPITSSI